MLRDDQRQWIMDFIDDSHKTDRDKIIFILHFLQSKDLIEGFAQHIGENYGFACSSHEEFENIMKNRGM